MRNLLLLGCFSLLAWTPIFSQHEGFFFGVPAKNDDCFRLLRSADGHFIFAGVVDNNAALYKFNCAGERVDSLQKDLSLPNSFEGFRDLIELPTGEFLAVGYAKVVTPNRDLILLMRLSADLQELDFDTLTLNGKSANAFKINRLGNRYFMAGYIAGTGLDFADVFVQELNPNTLSLIGTAKIFSYGIDELQSLETTADGGLLLSGHAVLGNIFVANAPLESKAFIRKIKTDGTLSWEHIRSQTLPNKFGRVTYNAVHENPVTGHIIAAGTHFTGDTLQNTLDTHLALLSENGVVLDTVQVTMAGQQNVYTLLPFIIPGVYIAGGDSTSLIAGNFAGATTTIFGENADEIILVAANSSPLPFSVKGLVNVPDERIAFAGVFYNPFEANAATNRDVFVALPIIELNIGFDGCEITSNITSEGSPNITYQWYLNGLPIVGATSGTHIPEASGEYQLLVTDAAGCNGISSSEALTVNLPQANFTYVQNNLSVQFQNTSVYGDTYFWSFGDGNNSIAFNPTHTYATVGNYTVRLVVTDACDLFRDTISVTIGITSQVANVETPVSIQVSPNPTATHFTLTSPEGMTAGTLSIFDFQGRRIRAIDINSNSQQISTEGLPNGTYWLRIMTGSNYLNTQKLVVLR
jgi:PKD repeat protein